MLYDLHNPSDMERFKKRSSDLIDKKCVVELTEKKPRTLRQNAYLHVCIAYLGCHLGLQADYVKDKYFKYLCNNDLFVREVDDKYLGKIRILRSSADLTTEETTTAIERFRNWAAREADVYIPEPDEEYFIQQMQIEIERNKNHL